MGLFSSFLDGLFNLGTDVYNANVQKEINQQNIDLQREINQQNWEQQWKMWEETNNYNSPVEQMKRYAEAGLNPHLIYGKSNMTTPVNVGTGVAPQAKAYQFERLGLVSGFLDNIAKSEAIRSQRLQNQFDEYTLEDRQENVALQNELITTTINKLNSDIEKQGVEKTSIEIKNDIDKYYHDNIQPLLKDLESNNVKLSDNEISMIPYRNRILVAQTKIEEFQTSLQHMEYLLQNQQFDLNETQRSRVLQDIEESKHRVTKLTEEISMFSHDKTLDWVNAGINAYGKLFQPFSFKGRGLKLFKLFKKK